MSASPEWTNYLRQQNLIKEKEINFAKNTLVVLGTPATPTITDLSELTTNQKLAMADPLHVPAGIYGKHALECAGKWNAMESSIIPTLDVRAALAALSSGAADLAIVYGSDVGLVPELKFMFQVPDSCMQEINYVISTLQRTANLDAAIAFVDFVTDSLQLNLWTKFGFSS